MKETAAGISGGRFFAHSIGMCAHFPDLSLELFQVLEGLGPLAGVPENGGGVQDGRHPDAGLLEPLAVFPGNLKIFLDQAHGGHPAQADDDLGSDQGHLAAQIADAGVLLGVQGVPVLGRTALDDVGDVHVGFPVQIDDLQHVVQQLARPAYEGLALEVLVLAGALADEHDLGIPGARSEDHVVPGVRQGALLTAVTGLLQGFPIHPCHADVPLFSKVCSV